MRNNVRGEPLGTDDRDKRKMAKRESEGDKGESQGEVCGNYERERDADRKTVKLRTQTPV